MKEIKYRSKSANEKVYYDVVNTIYPVDEFILKNIHGQDVYENDYIRDCDDKDIYYRVIWQSNCLCYDLLRINDEENMLGYLDNNEIMTTIYHCKVVGNMHGNPDFESGFLEIEEDE